MASAAAAETDVVILCGGLGTRLGNLPPDRPKPMADIGGKPFLEHLVDQAEGAGFRRFILCVGYRAESVIEHFSARQDVAIEFSREEAPLGTGGALKLAEPLCRGKTFLLMNGDSYCPIDLQGFLAFHGCRPGVATIAAVEAGDRQDGGVVEISPAGRVVRFAEKAVPEGKAWLNAGIYALDRRVFGFIPAGRIQSLEKDAFPRLLAAGVFAFPARAPLYDIGTPERLEAFRRAMAPRH